VHRQLVLAGHPVEALGFAFLLQAGAQVVGHARHELGADHFHARLLDGVVGVLRLAARGHAGVVHGVVVVAQAQGQAVGRAAQLGHLVGRQRPGGQRQAGTLAGEARGPGLEGDLHLIVLRDRAQHARGGPLELFGSGVVLGTGSAAAHHRLALESRPGGSLRRGGVGDGTWISAS
jgi:hypothetical protein